MKNTNKKGFTLVELLVVIAILAILATVAVVGYTSFTDKAHESNDRSLVAQLNTAVLRGDGKDYETMHEVIEALDAHGFIASRIDATAKKQEILWDMEEQKFFYSADADKKGAHIWIVSDKVSTDYSTYYIGANNATLNATLGFDAGVATGLTVKYAGSNDVVLRMNGGAIEVADISGAQQYFYGEADTAKVATGTSCFHVNGNIGFVELTAGKLVQVTGKTNAVVKADNAVVETKTGATVAKEYEASEVADIETIKTGATLFVGGTGTEADPYLIENAEQLMNITLNYDKGYAYYKVADGVDTIDCAVIPNKCISLNGSFDGNNAKFVNLAYQLFNIVGYQNNEDDITIANIDATFNSVDGGALIRSLINGGTTTFDNVQIHGYLEGSSNMGCFYKYGTAQYGSGASYTVNFINSKADATVVDISGNVVGGLIAHPFHGAGNTVTINLDANSGFFGAQYSTTGTGYNLASINKTGGANITFNGVEGYADPQINVNKITVVKAAQAEDGTWSIAKQGNVNSMTVSITAQYTQYDADGNEIANGRGLTAVVGTKVLTELEANTKVLEKVTGVAFVNEYLNGGMGYTIENGVLKVYVGEGRNVLSGYVRLQVAQYDANGNLISTGVVELGKVTK